MSNVVSAFGGPTGEREVNETLVAELEQWLERARSGEVTGMVGAFMHCDGMASYALAGFVGGYSLLGALEIAKSELVEFVR